MAVMAMEERTVLLHFGAHGSMGFGDYIQPGKHEGYIGVWVWVYIFCSGCRKFIILEMFTALE